ncbi:hypothetical protein DFR70_108175 [Nocardia tenerifensis]|uniref:Uncharacterized protein n=1 Tax=Nocardia tenerifensis TaxID=228006 RepID=A0A318K021_9NOCA|nr:hypothetical protein [Nocardia tenerifensis]PXX61617.1 hypothetical protein DFR70_108175 [Nocardia tenerifensis]
MEKISSQFKNGCELAQCPGWVGGPPRNALNEGGFVLLPTDALAFLVDRLVFSWGEWPRSVNGVSQEQVMLSGVFDLVHTVLGLVNSVLAVTENAVGILTFGILG